MVISSPVVRPVMFVVTMIFAPNQEISKIQEYIANCINGPLKANIFSALLNP